MIFLDHLVQTGYLVGRVLQVGVHSDDDIALCTLEPAVQGGTLAVVATELDGLDVFVFLAQALNDLPAVVGRTVVDEDDLVGEVIGLHDALYPGVQLRQRLGLIEKRNNY